MSGGNKPLHLADALQQYYYYARDLIQLLRGSNSYTEFNEMQEEFVDHRASHITWQEHNLALCSLQNWWAKACSLTPWGTSPGQGRWEWSYRLCVMSHLYCSETVLSVGHGQHAPLPQILTVLPAGTATCTTLVSTLSFSNGALWAPPRKHDNVQQFLWMICMNLPQILKHLSSSNEEHEMLVLKTKWQLETVDVNTET